MREIAKTLTAGLPEAAKVEVKLHAADALECDYGLDSLQTRAISALSPEGQRRTKDADEIPPNAAMFPLNTLEMAYGSARNLDYDAIRERMKSQGITIEDLAVNESPPPEQR